jgi:hypothetical protein
MQEDSPPQSPAVPVAANETMMNILLCDDDNSLIASCRIRCSLDETVWLLKKNIFQISPSRCLFMEAQHLIHYPPNSANWPINLHDISSRSKIDQAAMASSSDFDSESHWRSSLAVAQTSSSTDSKDSESTASANASGGSELCVNEADNHKEYVELEDSWHLGSALRDRCHWQPGMSASETEATLCLYIDSDVRSKPISNSTAS